MKQEFRWISTLRSTGSEHESAGWLSKETNYGGMVCVMLAQDELLRAPGEVKG
jgi:hypothetical protein